MCAGRCKEEEKMKVRRTEQWRNIREGAKEEGDNEVRGTA